MEKAGFRGLSRRRMLWRVVAAAAIAACHAAFSVPRFVSMGCQAVDSLKWRTMPVRGMPQPILDNGFITGLDASGLGLELNEAGVEEHVSECGCFGPTREYEKVCFVCREHRNSLALQRGRGMG